MGDVIQFRPRAKAAPSVDMVWQEPTHWQHSAAKDYTHRVFMADILAMTPGEKQALAARVRANRVTRVDPVTFQMYVIDGDTRIDCEYLDAGHLWR